jgi:hypothetical protein
MVPPLPAWGFGLHQGEFFEHLQAGKLKSHLSDSLPYRI